MIRENPVAGTSNFADVTINSRGGSPASPLPHDGTLKSHEALISRSSAQFSILRLHKDFAECSREKDADHEFRMAAGRLS